MSIQNPEPIPILVEKLQQTQQMLIAMLRPLADVQDWRPDAENWSFRYIAAHLAITEQDCFLPRAAEISSGSKPEFPYFWHTHANFDEIELTDALTLWQEKRRELLDYVAGLGGEALTFTGHHATFGDFTVAGLLTIAQEHDEEHIADLGRDIAQYQGDSG